MTWFNNILLCLFLNLNKKQMKVISWIALILVVVGGLNRGLVAWLDLNLVAKVFPDVTSTVVDVAWVATVVTTISLIAKIVYSLVALSAIYVLVGAFKKD